jgi:hypothetical protein
MTRVGLQVILLLATLIPRVGEKPKSESEFLIDVPKKSNHPGMMGGLSSLYFSYDERRRPRGGSVTEKFSNWKIPKYLSARRASERP